MTDYEINGDAARSKARERRELLNWGRSRTDRFWRWLVDHCNITGMDNWFFGEFPKEGASVRGMGATRFIKAGELVTCVPKTCWHTDKDYSEEVAQMTTAEFRICSDQHKLAIHMAREMHKMDATKYAPYYDAMPNAAEMGGYHPAYLDKAPFPRHNDMWDYMNKALMECYIEYALNQGADAVPYETVRLASAMMSSRAFHITGLPPPMDFANTDRVHSLSVVTEELNESGYPINRYDGSMDAENSYNSTHYFCFRAMRDLYPGEELTDPYGSEHKDVATNFRLYAFTFEDESIHAPSFVRDYCEGMYPHQWQFPGHDAPGPLLNYWRFAKKHCDKLMWGGTVPELCHGAWVILFLLNLASGFRNRKTGVMHGAHGWSAKGTLNEKSDQSTSIPEKETKKEA